MIKKPIYTEFNLDSMTGNSRAIAVSHIDDTNTEVLEVCVRQRGEKIDLTGATVKARMVWHKEKTLVSDNVTCTIDSGNVLIPFDNAAIQTHEGILKIEVNITRQRDVLTLQFPIYVKINDTILADAKVTPESQGTVPELLKEVKEELARVQGYVDEGRVFEILDAALSGDPNIIPSLFVEQTPSGEYQLVYVDSDLEEKHVIFNFGNLPAAKGEKGDKGDKGDPGENAYEVAVKHGYSGTEDEWLESLRGKNGADGAPGAKGDKGDPGEPGAKGADGFSPTAAVTKSGTVSTITVTDKNGTTTVTVHDGASGSPGADGNAIWKTTVAPTAPAAPEKPGYGFEISNLTGADREVQVGDIVFYSYYYYHVSQIIGSVAYAAERVSIRGSKGAQGPQGDNYVLTTQDKSDIANIVLSELPTTEGVLYGNTSN